MSNTRFDPTHSPAKPIMVTPLEAGVALFFYNKTTKDTGFSPNGKRVIPLNKYEGRHHVKGRDEAGNIFTEDSPVKSSNTSNQSNLSCLKNKLTLRLVNLKERTDEDYKSYIKNGEISSNHYEATRIKIAQCINVLKTCYLHSEDKNQFIEAYNQQIKNGRIYNLFCLRNFYKSEVFDDDKYQQACDEINYQRNLTREDVEGERPVVRRPRDEANMFYVPRNVKAKLNENQSSGSSPSMSSKRQLSF